MRKYQHKQQKCFIFTFYAAKSFAKEKSVIYDNAKLHTVMDIAMECHIVSFLFKHQPCKFRNSKNENVWGFFLSYNYLQV